MGFNNKFIKSRKAVAFESMLPKEERKAKSRPSRKERSKAKNVIRETYRAEVATEVGSRRRFMLTGHRDYLTDTTVVKYQFTPKKKEEPKNKASDFDGKYVEVYGCKGLMLICNPIVQRWDREMIASIPTATLFLFTNNDKFNRKDGYMYLDYLSPSTETTYETYHQIRERDFKYIKIIE